jgi:hypothetical protein
MKETQASYCKGRKAGRIQGPVQDVTPIPIRA